MHSDGTCKAISANCVKASYANAAHNNVATTGCTCVANCGTCSSKTACGTCNQLTWNAAADFTYRVANTCADKKVYCANGAKLACGGSCVAASGSNCG
jgi:hypothetical protein